VSVGGVTVARTRPSASNALTWERVTPAENPRNSYDDCMVRATAATYSCGADAVRATGATFSVGDTWVGASRPSASSGAASVDRMRPSTSYGAVTARSTAAAA
jgi:hypothetical protein